MHLSNASFNELSFDNSVKLVFSFKNKVSMEELLKSAVFRYIKLDTKKCHICFCFDINCSSVMQVGYI